MMVAGGARASTLVTVEEALALAFPGAATQRQTLFLTDDELERIALLAGGRPTGAIVTRHRAELDGELVGWAYLDTHRVRTLPETVLIVVAPDGGIQRVEVVSFREPLEYLPRASWYRQFDDRRLDERLQLDRGIRPVTGATLTVRATTEAVRRVLAVHRVVGEGPRP